MSFMVLDIFGSLKELEKKHPDFYRRIQSFYIRADGAYVHLKDRGFEVYLGSRITIDKLEKLRALTLILESYTTNGSSVEDIEKIDLSLTYAAVQKGERKNELR